MKEHCRRVLEQVYLFLDGEVLSYEERIEIQGHVEECRPCYERYGLEEEVSRMIARLRGSCHCPDSLKEKISHLIDEA